MPRTDIDTLRPTGAPASATRMEVIEPDLRAPVLERLHALVRKGYRPEIGVDTATDVVVLRHLGRAPDLVLYADGLVEGLDARRPRHKRDVEPPPAFRAGLADQLRFMKFLDSVPRPSLRDRTRRWRHKYIYFPVVVAILLAIHLAFTAIILEGAEDDPRPRPEVQAETAAPGGEAQPQQPSTKPATLPPSAPTQ